MKLRRNRDFMLLQAGQLLSGVGTGTATIAYPLLVLAVTGSAAKAGVVGFARLAPAALLGLAGGWAADRWNRKRLMIGADVVRALAVGGLAAAVLLHRAALWEIAVVALVEGTGALVFYSAQMGALRSVVPREQLADAASAQQARAAAARLAAPPLGGALFQLGRALPFLGDAVSYACSTAALLAMRTPFQEERERDESRMRAQLVEGLGFIWRRPFLRDTTLMIGVSSLVVAAGQLAVIVLAHRQGLSGGAIGGLVALLGVTTLAGSVAAPFLRRLVSLRVILLSEFWAASGTLAFLVWPNVYVLAGTYAAQAFCFPNTDSAMQAFRLAVTPDRLVGRVAAAGGNLATLLAAAGPLAGGVLLAALSPRAAVGAFTAVALALAVWGTLSPAIRHAPSLNKVILDAELGSDEASAAAAG